MFPNGIWQDPQLLLANLEWLLGMGIDWNLVIQIGLLALCGLWVYIRFIQKSQAEQLLKGLSVVLLFFLALFSLAFFLELKLLVAVFGFGVQILVVALIVIFQPELRNMLFYLGQPEFLGGQLFSLTPLEQKAEFLINELTDTARFLSRSKTGALIVLESANNPGANYLEAGSQLDARLSTELLLTIFHPKTPLHDGAVVIDADNRIVAAGVLLPLTEDPKLSWQHGTRHRAAIGLSEVSPDSYCLVVSEETGNISFVNNGKLEKMANADELKKHMERLYKVNVSTKRESKKVASLSSRFSDIFSGDTLHSQIQRIFLRQSKKELKTASPTKKEPKAGGGGSGPSAS